MTKPGVRFAQADSAVDLDNEYGEVPIDSNRQGGSLLDLSDQINNESIEIMIQNQSVAYGGLSERQGGSSDSSMRD